MKKSKAFTLIELIAVLVILAILALIVTPLVLNIIRKARVSADKRSIDAYGRSIELAIADYLLDKGEFPTSIEQLTIEYTGDKVECETTKLNSDSSVYLAGCTVGGRTVSGYTYGKEQTVTYKAYSVGDKVTYNSVDYYVIANSDEKDESVKLLKAEPLTINEVNLYGIGHTNRKTYQSVGTAYNDNGYGSIAYYSSETCGYNGTYWISDNCSTLYDKSEVKYVVDAWAADKITNGLKEARLITFDELIDLGYDESKKQCTASCYYNNSDEIPGWVYSSSYWTMSIADDSNLTIWQVNSNNLSGVYEYNLSTVRPVIVISKSAL